MRRVKKSCDWVVRECRVCIGEDHGGISACGHLCPRNIALYAALHPPMGSLETRNRDYDWRVATSVASILPKVWIHWGSERDSLESGLSFLLFAKRRRNPRVPHDTRVVDKLGPISVAVQVLSLMLAAIGKTKVKLFLIGWIVAVFAAEYIVFQVAFD
jgi:hypothetical protein